VPAAKVAATAVAAAEQPIAAVTAAPLAAEVANAAGTPPAATQGRGSRAGRARTVTLLEPPAEEDEEGEGCRQGAVAAAGPAVDAEARRAAAEIRAKERIDARLAEIGLAASTAVRGGGRTALRAAQPGEACFSKNGKRQLTYQHEQSEVT
jgi:hypothetical protein